ncbi:MAG: ATP synthase subunit I [Actinomycetia bacterium]|nr:ATP synthase subunit I [Actinomycetes bacterium]
MTAELNVLESRLDGESPALEVCVDMLRRMLPVIPVMLLLAALGWGANGAASAGYAMAIVAVNFLLAAISLAWAGRISFALMAGAALFGYLIRLGLIFLAVMLVRNVSWVDLVPLGLTLIATHLGLLFWELRFVSGSLAYPGVKPGAATLSTTTTSTTRSTAS